MQIEPGEVVVICPAGDIIISGVAKTPEIDDKMLHLWGADDNQLAVFKEWEGWAWVNRCHFREDLPPEVHGEFVEDEEEEDEDE